LELILCHEGGNVDIVWCAWVGQVGIEVTQDDRVEGWVFVLGNVDVSQVFGWVVIGGNVRSNDEPLVLT